jgi:hypothetical protein
MIREPVCILFIHLLHSIRYILDIQNCLQVWIAHVTQHVECIIVLQPTPPMNHMRPPCEVHVSN